MAVTVTHEGKTYTRSNGKWVTSTCMVVHEILQDELNKLYFETIDLSMLELLEIVRDGDAFKSSASYGLAVRLYTYAIERSDEDGVAYILPRLTSCYRKQGRAKDVIELASKIKRKYGSKMFTPTLLTSIAAAYCDLDEYDNALKCCNRAYAQFGGKASGELSLVYKRIDAAQR